MLSEMCILIIALNILEGVIYYYYYILQYKSENYRNFLESNPINSSSSENEIIDLTNQLIEAHEKIEQQNKMLIDLNKDINDYKKKINEQKDIIKENEEEINKLKTKINDISKPKELSKKVYEKDMVCVNFLSQDQIIRFAVPCSKNNTFAEIEEKLYQQHPEYRNTNNNFIANGQPILRFKTIGENKIGAGFPVILVAP